MRALESSCAGQVLELHMLTPWGGEERGGYQLEMGVVWDRRGLVQPCPEANTENTEAWGWIQLPQAKVRLAASLVQTLPGAVVFVSTLLYLLMGSVLTGCCLWSTCCLSGLRFLVLYLCLYTYMCTCLLLVLLV